MTTFLVAIFVASLVGSLHCAGMCGGVVALSVLGAPVRGARAWWPPVGYNLGRAVTYAALGTISGAAGAAIDLGGTQVGLGRVAAVVAGLMMILIGGGALLRAPLARAGLRPAAWRLPKPIESRLHRAIEAARKQPPHTRSILLGLLTGFLPCGWLYAFVLAAAGTGSTAAGAVTMLVFWAGTVPILLALGLGLPRLLAPVRHHVPTLTAAVLVVVGIIAIAGRLGAPAYADVMQAEVQASSDRAASAPIGDAVTTPQTLELATPACCDVDPDAATDDS